MTPSPLLLTAMQDRGHFSFGIKDDTVQDATTTLSEVSSVKNSNTSGTSKISRCVACNYVDERSSLVVGRNRHMNVRTWNNHVDVVVSLGLVVRLPYS